ncbi:MAG: TRAP transporter TatT component family protein [bacterium]|nr:TRAP transporter TatT component family protein [bacterium]
MKITYLRKFSLLTLCLLALTAPGCFKQVATKATSSIFYDAAPTVDREDDVELAEAASLSFLKMLEGLYGQNPRDKITLLMLARSYAGFAYGFTENEIIASKGSNKKAYDKAMARARRFYSRAKRYGLELLVLLPGMSKAEDMTLQEFEDALNGLGKSQVENLFWIGFAWGNYLNFHKDSVEAIASLPKIELVMKRVLALDPDYYYGGAYIFMGAFYGSRPKILGGNPPLAKENFDEAIGVTAGKNLMSRVTKAQFYAVQVQDMSLYKRLLQQVLNSDPAALPEMRLLNEIAQIRANLLLKKKSLFFTQANNKK